MRELWNGLTAFYREAGSCGAYFALFAASLLCLSLTGMSREEESGVGGTLLGPVRAGERLGCGRRIAGGALVWSIVWMNPLTAMLLQKAAGLRFDYGNASLLLPVLPLIACTAAELAGRVEEGGAKRAAAVIMLGAALMLAGTVYPFCPGEGLRRQGGAESAARDAEIESILAEADKLEQEGQIPFLAGPGEVMEWIRRYDARIVLAYGSNLWRTGALTYVNDRYSEEQIVLCQHMEAQEFSADETARLAYELGCNLIALREPLTETFLKERELREVFAAEGFYLYVR